MGEFQILLIDDDEIFAVQLKQALLNVHPIQVAKTYEEAQKKIRDQAFDIILLDKYLPRGKLGTDLIPEIKAIIPSSVIIVLTAEKPDHRVFEALKAGATDYLHKTKTVISDLNSRMIIAVQRVALERRLSKAESLAADRMNVEMIGNSEAMVHLRVTIRTLCQQNINILILGETGTGKELVARSLNQSHGDRSRPFVAINCAAIPPGLVESELFGHKKGAFTGATFDKVGKIESAHGGDLFLDETGELPMDVQTKLLRVLQEGEFSPIGDNRVKRSQFRVISATNRDLQRMVHEGRFREDLYYRLAAHEIYLAPLRERKEDIPDLVNHLIRKLEGPRFSVEKEVIQHFSDQHWSGNVRELENKVRSGLAFAKARNSYTVTLKDVLNSKEGQKDVRLLVSANLRTKLFSYTQEEYSTYLSSVEKEYLVGALDAGGWDIEFTARKLGFSRSKLYQKISVLGLERPRRLQLTEIREDHQWN